MYGWQRRRRSGGCPGGASGCKTLRRECLVLPPALSGLGGGFGGCSRGSRVCAPQPAIPPVSVHMYHAGVLPPAGQAVYHVPVTAADPGRPPAASLGKQVSQGQY